MEIFTLVHHKKKPPCLGDLILVDLSALFSNPVEPNPLGSSEQLAEPDHTADAGRGERPHRQHQRRLGVDEVADLIERYQGGENAQDLAVAFRIHRTTVTGHLERNGVRRRVGARVLTDSDVEVAAELYEVGHSLAKLGERFDVHPKTVATELRQAGVEIRARRGWLYHSPQ